MNMETQNSPPILPFCDEYLAPFNYSNTFDHFGDGAVPGDSSLGFMNLFGLDDFGSSMLDFPPASAMPMATPSTFLDISETVNLPGTPNSLSVSTSSNEMAKEDHMKVVEEEEEEEEQKNTKKELKAKRKKKLVREPQFAFFTKSEIDQLEDGYRWRKYGQKAVKNSPFPRSYYRCTTRTCGVKKRVERSYDDPTVVVTTYEGRHTHVSPSLPRRSSSTAEIQLDSNVFVASSFTSISTL